MAELPAFKKQRVPNNTKTLTLMSMISPSSVVANQIVEGGVDSTIVQNFFAQALAYVREQPENRGRRVVLFMDNAKIHKGSNVYAMTQKYKVDVLFNCPYSPQLNPIEHFFKTVKQGLRSNELTSQ